jgi:hypothetical protein
MLYANGSTVSDIARKFADDPELDRVPPYQTIKGWVKGVSRGSPDDEPWDFLAATDAERQAMRLYFRSAPKARMWTHRGVSPWPSAEVARWFCAIASLLPPIPPDDDPVWERAYVPAWVRAKEGWRADVVTQSYAFVVAEAWYMANNPTDRTAVLADLMTAAQPDDMTGLTNVLVRSIDALKAERRHER